MHDFAIQFEYVLRLSSFALAGSLEPLLKTPVTSLRCFLSLACQASPSSKSSMNAQVPSDRRTIFAHTQFPLKRDLEIDKLRTFSA